MSFKKYARSTMLQLLPVMLTATEQTRLNGGFQIPYFYESDEAIVFPPVSDVEQSINQLETIATTLTQSAVFLNDERFLGKKFIFPVVEEQRFLMVSPRNHWVTLHYDPHTQIATLIDSRPSVASFWYSTAALQASLVNGLKTVNLTVSQFDVKYQGVQDDFIRCGAWVATNIELLAHGKTVADLLRELKASARDRMVLHHQHRLNSGKNSGVFQPCSSDNDTSSLNTDETIEMKVLDLESFDFPDDVELCVDTEALREQEKMRREARWIETATLLVHHTLDNPNSLILALIARESIIYRGSKLSDDCLGHFSAQHILAKMEAIEQQDDFGIYDHSRLGSGLRVIGFEEDIIRSLSLSDVLMYDAVICSAINNAGNAQFYADCMPAIECPTTLMATKAEEDEFKIRLFASIKNQINTLLSNKPGKAVELTITTKPHGVPQFFKSPPRHCLPEVRNNDPKHNFLSEFDVLMQAFKRELDGRYRHLLAHQGQLKAIQKVRRAIRTMHNQMVRARIDFAKNNNQHDFSSFYNTLFNALNKGQAALGSYPQFSYLEWFAEKIHNLGALLVQLVNQYLLGKPHTLARYRNTQVLTQQLVTECATALLTTKNNMQTFFAARGHAPGSSHDVTAVSDNRANAVV